MANIKQILKGIIGSISRLNRLAQTRFDFNYVPNMSAPFLAQIFHESHFIVEF